MKRNIALAVALAVSVILLSLATDSVRLNNGRVISVGHGCGLARTEPGASHHGRLER